MLLVADVGNTNTKIGVFAFDDTLITADGRVRRRVVAGEIGGPASAIAPPVESDAPRR